MNSEIPLEIQVADYLSDFYAHQHNFPLRLKKKLEKHHTPHTELSMPVF